MNKRPKLGSRAATVNDRIWVGSTPQVGRASLSFRFAAVRRSVDLTVKEDGAQLFAQALDEAACGRLESALATLPTSRPGLRIGEGRQLQTFLDAPGPIGSIAASMLGNLARPVRAILFDKTAERNWALGWHHDRTIVVKARFETDGFGP